MRSCQQQFWLILALSLDHSDFICVEISVAGGIHLLGMILYQLDTINFLDMWTGTNLYFYTINFQKV